jgi:hypothetical protein
LAHPPRQEGRIAIVTDAGLDAVDAAASGAIVVAVSDLTFAQTTGVSRPSPLSSVGISPVGVAGEGAAYGEVVWFWHPWLMSSQRRRVGPTGLQTNLNPLATVTKRNSSPGRARSKP